MSGIWNTIGGWLTFRLRKDLAKTSSLSKTFDPVVAFNSLFDLQISGTLKETSKKKSRV
jgi:hypothetical protein